MTGLGSTIANGVLLLEGSAKTLSNRSLVSNDTGYWAGGNIACGYGAVISTAANTPFTVNATSSVALTNAGGAICNLQSAGSFYVTTSVSLNVTIQINVTFYTSVQINIGTVYLATTGVNGGAFYGTITVASGARLDLSGGVYALPSPAVVQGLGQLSVSGGTVNIGAQVSISVVLVISGTVNCSPSFVFTVGVLTVQGGTVNFVVVVGVTWQYNVQAIVQQGGSITVGSGGSGSGLDLQVPNCVQQTGGTFTVNGTMQAQCYNLTSGIIDGQGELTVVQNLFFNGGTMRGSGSTVSNGTLVLGGTNKTLSQRSLQIYNAGFWSSGNVQCDTNGLIVVNDQTTLTINATSSVALSLTSGQCSLVSNGNVISTSPGNTTVSVSVQVGGQGWHQKAGSVAFTNNGTFSSALEIAPGAQVLMNGVYRRFLSTSDVQNAGALQGGGRRDDHRGGADHQRHRAGQRRLDRGRPQLHAAQHPAADRQRRVQLLGGQRIRVLRQEHGHRGRRRQRLLVAGHQARLWQHRLRQRKRHPDLRSAGPQRGHGRRRGLCLRRRRHHRQRFLGRQRRPAVDHGRPHERHGLHPRAPGTLTMRGGSKNIDHTRRRIVNQGNATPGGTGDLWCRNGGVFDNALGANTQINGSSTLGLHTNDSSVCDQFDNEGSGLPHLGRCSTRPCLSTTRPRATSTCATPSCTSSSRPRCRATSTSAPPAR